MAAGRVRRGIVDGLNRRGLRGQETSSPSAADVIGRPKAKRMVLKARDQFLAAKLGPRPLLAEGTAKKDPHDFGPTAFFFRRDIGSTLPPPSLTSPKATANPCSNRSIARRFSGKAASGLFR